MYRLIQLYLCGSRILPTVKWVILIFIIALRKDLVCHFAELFL